jgi:hypothetical protein
MSKASEWVNTMKPVEAARPSIDLRSLDPDDDYVVTARVETANVGNATGEPVLAFETDDEGTPAVLRAENAIRLAHWILETFGDAAQKKK